MEAGVKELGVVSEAARDVPVVGAYDVVVAGGGIAGVAAAVAAARLGVSVCLLEKMYALGGLATLGNVTIWLPICDGRGRQVIGGLAEELLKLSVRDLHHNRPAARFVGIPPCWLPGGDLVQRQRVRYRTEFNPSSYLLALEELVAGAGVSLQYDTRVCAAGVDEGRIRHLIVENKSGRGAIACRTVIDATGDADVCFLAGEQTESLDTNVLCGWFYHLDDQGLTLHQMSNRYSPRAEREGSHGPFFRGDRAADVTAQVLGSRDLIRRRLAALRARNEAADIQVVSPPTVPCLRMTRRLVGSVSLTEAHVHHWFADTVGLTGDWRKAGPVYAIPLAALRGVVTRNLTAAGRCISATGPVWDATRAIPACALTGEIAGTASALAVRHYVDSVLDVPAEALRRELEEHGAILDPVLVAPAPA